MCIHRALRHLHGVGELLLIGQHQRHAGEGHNIIRRKLESLSIQESRLRVSTGEMMFHSAAGQALCEVELRVGPAGLEDKRALRKCGAFVKSMHGGERRSEIAQRVGIIRANIERSMVQLTGAKEVPALVLGGGKVKEELRRS